MYSFGHLFEYPAGTIKQQSVKFDIWVEIVNSLIPYYKHFFDFYKTNQKLHVLRFMSNYKVFDRELFQNFINELHKTRKYSDEQFETYVRNLCFSQDPVSNQSMDHFNDLLQVLDFYQLNVMQAQGVDNSPGDKRQKRGEAA